MSFKTFSKKTDKDDAARKAVKSNDPITVEKPAVDNSQSNSKHSSK